MSCAGDFPDFINLTNSIIPTTNILLVQSLDVVLFLKKFPHIALDLEDFRWQVSCRCLANALAFSL